MSSRAIWLNARFAEPKTSHYLASRQMSVDNLTVLNGAQGISEIISQVIGQAGPALKMAQEALGRQNGGQTARAEKVTAPDSQT